MSWSCVVLWAVIASRPIHFAPLGQRSAKSATVASASAESRGAVSDLEADVVANLKKKDIRLATLDDLELPASYLHRVAGRILRSSFEENFRSIASETTLSDARTPDARGMPVPEADARPASARNEP